MLKIQLCPESEFENRFWWAPDLVAFVVVCAIGWMAAGFFLGQITDETNRLTQATDRWTKEEASLKTQVEIFKGLEQDAQILTRKIENIKKITVSKTDKVWPIVGLEQLQTLRPEGIWYQTLEWNEDGGIAIVGAGTDSLLISEFLMGLRETMNPQTWSQDIRTMSGFKDIMVETVESKGDPIFSDIKTGVLNFKLKAKAATKPRPPGVGPSAMAPMPRSSEGAMF